MATTSKYFVINSSGDSQDFLDFELNYGGGSISTVGQNILYNGTSGVDAIFVRPGSTYDLTNTSGNIDKIYLTGSLSDYHAQINNNGNLVLTRNVGGQIESVTLTAGNQFNYDSLIFANGKVSNKDVSEAITNNTALPVPNAAETSLHPLVPSSLSASLEAWSTNTAPVGQRGETFASTKAGVSLVVHGGSGIDTVYVADGEVVDATGLAGSVDKVYMRGTWESYEKTVLANGNLEFKRLINGFEEKVTVTGGNGFSFDQLIFANGSVTTFNAVMALAVNPLAPITSVAGINLTTVTPLYNDFEVAAALAAIQDAAQNNTATDTTPSLTTYAIAGVTGVDASNRAAINSALSSNPVTGAQATTAAQVQGIVNAYTAILGSADGPTGSTTAIPLAGNLFAAVGVTGVAGMTPIAGSAMALMDSVVDVATHSQVDTVAELQSLADAAARVMAAAGGTTSQATALTLDDLTALAITGVTPANLWAVQSAIQAATSDTAVDSQSELQALVTAAIDGVAIALNKIQYAAENNLAALGDPTHPALTVQVFNAASISGVTAGNLASVNSALDSAAVNGAQATTATQVQMLVDGYNAILASANGTHSPSATPLSAAGYAAIGVTGLAAANGAGTVLALLDDVVDLSIKTAVDIESEVQAMASAAAHVMQDVGIAGTAAHVTVADLAALGIAGVGTTELVAVRVAIQALTDPKLVDSQYELQTLVNTTLGKSALNVIAAAAEANTATATLTLASYTAAGVTGVDASNLAPINSALDSAAIDGARADTLPRVQAIVDAYQALLTAANGTPGSTPVTAEQFFAIGVTGVTGSTTDTGTALHLLDDVADLSGTSTVNTVAKVQALADAAAHVMELTGNPNATLSANFGANISPSAQELNTLMGNNQVTPLNLTAIQNALKLGTDAGLDTRAELQALVDNVNNIVLPAALGAIQYAALNNVAATGDGSHSALSTSTYAAAGVIGVDASNLAAVNSALDSVAITDVQTTTTAQVQAIVGAYQAILANADGWSDNDPPLSGEVFTAVGVTGLPTGAPAVGSALNLLSSVVDQSKSTFVDSVAELQAMADAAKHVLVDVGAAGPSTTSLADLQALNIVGVDPSNLSAVQAAIKGLNSTSLVDTQGELQRLVDSLLGNLGTALLKISAAAENNNANGALGVAAIAVADYVAASVTGVSDGITGNLASINSALNSAAINGDMTDTTAEVQAVVDGYNAILASADHTLNAINPLSAAQFASIGVTGVSGPYAAGNALHLLDDVVYQALVASVDTVPEVQAMADAAKAVMTGSAAGTGPTLAQLGVLGITGVTGGNLVAVQAAIAATPDDGTGVDTQAELQAVVNGGAAAASLALNAIRDAAQNNNATDSSPGIATYVTAGATGVTAVNLAAINSALNSTPVTGAKADTTDKVQTIVNDYTAILNSADGTAGNTATPLTAAQYTDIGVTGVSTGSALHLLDDVVDGKAQVAVDTVLEVQALADAANAVQAQAAGTAGLTLAQLNLLGVTGLSGGIMSGVSAAIAATDDSGSAVDTLAKIQTLVNGVNHSPTINNPSVSNGANSVYAQFSVTGTAMGGPNLEYSPVELPDGTGGTYPWESVLGWNYYAPGMYFNNLPMIRYTNSVMQNYTIDHVGDPSAPGTYVHWRDSIDGGKSLNGGDFAVLTSSAPQYASFGYQGMQTTLTNLVVGQTYVYGLQWQQMRDLFIWDGQENDYHAGGQLVMSVGGHAQIFTSSGLNDSWNTALYSFKATSASETLQVSINGLIGITESPYPVVWGWNTYGGTIAVDSLSTAQVMAANPAVQGAGATASALFGSVSDTDTNASLKGWAITSAANDGAGHHWQYSSDQGASWHDMDGASTGQAIYLATTDLIHWTGLKGTNTELDARAVDNTGPALHATNALAGLVDTTQNGGSTAYSGNTAILAAHAPPLLLDLNHDGEIQYSQIDMTQDGQSVHTAWVGASDGMLFWDKLADGSLHGSDQYVFGKNTGSDLNGLRALVDSNNDFQFNAQDAQFSHFGVWQDANQNGNVDAGEYRTLSQWGITSLALNSIEVNTAPAQGVNEVGHTTATLAQGGSMLVVDANFEYSHLPFAAPTSPEQAFALGNHAVI